MKTRVPELDYHAKLDNVIYVKTVYKALNKVFSNHFPKCELLLYNLERVEIVFCTDQCEIDTLRLVKLNFQACSIRKRYGTQHSPRCIHNGYRL